MVIPKTSVKTNNAQIIDRVSRAMAGRSHEPYYFSTRWNTNGPNIPSFGLGSNIGRGLFVGWVEHPDIFCWVSFLYPTYLPAIFVLSAKPNKMAEDRIIPHHSIVPLFHYSNCERSELRALTRNIQTIFSILIHASVNIVVSRFKV